MIELHTYGKQSVMAVDDISRVVPANQKLEGGNATVWFKSGGFVTVDEDVPTILNKLIDAHKASRWTPSEWALFSDAEKRTALGYPASL